MEALIQRALAHLRGMWHRRWIGLAAAWIAAIVGAVVAYKIPERYEASARVYVDTQSLLRPVMAGLAIQPNLDQQVGLMSRTLISRPNVEKLVRMADLDLRTTTNAEREELIDGLMKTLQLAGNVSTNLYVISFRDSNPDQARKVVSSLLTIFVESSLGDKRQDSRAAVKFLDEQIKRYEVGLLAAENRLKEFKLKYLGMPGQGQDFFSKIAKLGDDIEAVRVELRSAEQSRDAYKRDLAGESPTFLPERGSAAAVAVPEVDARIAALKTRLDELLRTYTDQHPDVVGTRRVIGELEAQRKQEVEAMQKAASAAGRPADIATNPVFQQMRVSLSDAEANVASLRSRLASLENQYQHLKSTARMVPQVEAEFAQLNRDYDVQKKTYGELLARRESAAMGVDVQETGGTQIRVIDPPRVAPQPVPPTRLMLLAAAFVIALGIGVGASFVANEVMPMFLDSRSLRDATKRPIVGTVSMLATAEVTRSRRRKAWLFAGGAGGLVASCIAILTVAFLAVRVS